MKTATELAKFEDNDSTAFDRKLDHIELAFKSVVGSEDVDKRFFYEPALSAHPDTSKSLEIDFMGSNFCAPFWVSSMTGGTQYAKTINSNLARVANTFKFGMGLGSCRSLLSSNEHLEDFNVRSIIGDDLPLYANLGVAQIEYLLRDRKSFLIGELINKLQADGLIIHINPMQEWLQPEGDKFNVAPIETIKRLLDLYPELKYVVKEVGQGMGYESLKALCQLPLEAIEFAANGGTNFAKLEMLRSDKKKAMIYSKLANIGHTAEDMVDMLNKLHDIEQNVQVKHFIISGGVKDFLDGYFLVQKSKFSAVYGQASGFLKYAKESYESLHEYVSAQLEGYKLANAFLKIRD